MLSLGQDWTKSLKDPSNGDIVFTINPSFIPEGSEDEVKVVVSLDPDLMVTLHRELTFDHGKSVGHKVTLLWKVINGSGKVYKEALHGYDHEGRTLTLRMHPNGKAIL